MNLLIVDDEVITVKGMMNGVDWKACGIDGSIWVAYDARQAMQIVKAQAVDLMLCDIEMPSINGIELLRQIRQDKKNLACIFLTCHARFEYAHEAVRLGCKDYILKPASYESISEVLTRVCRELDEHHYKEEIARYSEKQFKQSQDQWEENEKLKPCGADIVKEAEAYILSHIKQTDLSIPEIADHSCVNKDYLNRIFKKEKNVSIRQFIIQERMRLAALLLENSHLTIHAVAEEAGYNNAPYFISTFKRFFGCTPFQYRTDRQNAPEHV